MPPALLRAAAHELPYAFERNDSLAMKPNNRLCSHAEVDLVARICRSGQALLAGGGLVGSLTWVKLGSGDVRLVIDTVRSTASWFRASYRFSSVNTPADV